jgi:hypothetical protein
LFVRAINCLDSAGRSINVNKTYMENCIINEIANILMSTHPFLQSYVKNNVAVISADSATMYVSIMEPLCNSPSRPIPRLGISQRAVTGWTR